MGRGARFQLAPASSGLSTASRRGRAWTLSPCTLADKQAALVKPVPGLSVAGGTRAAPKEALGGAVTGPSGPSGRQRRPLTVYDGVRCLDVVSYASFPTSNLYDGRKWMSGSWKPLKTDPGAGAGRLRPAGAGLRLRPQPRSPPRPLSLPLPAPPFCISRVSWSSCSRAGTLAPGSCLRMASTATRPAPRRKLKSPNQNTPSKRVVTSAAAQAERA